MHASGRCLSAALLIAACASAPALRAASAADAEGQDTLEQKPVVRSQMFDADMVRWEAAGHQAFILRPAKPGPGGAKPWVWYAPTLLADREEDWKSPGKRHAWIFGRLLAGGLYVAGVDVGESYGSPAGRAVYDKFYDLMVQRFGFSPKPCLLPVSRGGLMAYNWAADHPDRVQCIGGIYPVCDLRPFAGSGRILKAYRMSEQQLRAELQKHNPIDRLAPLAAAGVPILHVQGDSDNAVPLEAHSAELARRYKALGGRADVIVVPGKGHEVAPELWQEPGLVEFFLKQAPRPVQTIP